MLMKSSYSRSCDATAANSLSEQFQRSTRNSKGATRRRTSTDSSSDRQHSERSLLLVKSNDNADKKGGSSTRQKMEFASMALCLFGFGLCHGILSPFYPQYAADVKNLSPTMIGLIFSSFEIVMFIMCPIAGIFAPKLGPKFMIFWGTIMSGSGTILTGFLSECRAGEVFAVLSLATRAVSALGAALYITAAFGVSASILPDNISLVYGLLEASNGVGLAVGPALGGFLYEIGGFGISFWLLGGLMLCFGFFTSMLRYFADSTEVMLQSTDIVNPMLLYRQPIIVLSILCYVSLSVAWSFLQPTLGPYLTNDIGISDAGSIGIVFLIGAVIYATGSLLAGPIIDRIRHLIILLSATLFISATVWLFLAPVPLIARLYSPTYLSICIIYALIASNVPIAVLVIPKLLIIGAIDAGLNVQDVNVQATISGAYNLAWYLGTLLGPLISGPMVTSFEFPRSTAIISLILFISACVCFAYNFTKNCSITKRKHRKPSESIIEM